MKNTLKNITSANQYLLFIFILLSAIVKCYQIEFRSFSLDELYSVAGALEPNFRNSLENWIFYDSNPPLYYLFLRIWLMIVPATEFWIRLPSIIFVLLASYIFINGIKKRFENDSWFYLLLLFGTCFGFLFFAQEARAYALLFLFVCLQLLYFIDLINETQSKGFLKHIFPFILFTILSSYTHYSGIVFSVILFIVLVFVHRNENQKLKQLSLSILICLCAGLPWLKYFMILLKIDKSFIINQDFTIIKEIISMLFFGNNVIGKYLTIFFSLYILIICFRFIKNANNSHLNIKILLIIGLISSLIILLSPFLPFFFQYRHYMVLMPIILLSISFILAFNNFKKHSNNIFIIIAFIIVLSQGFTFYKSKREEWRQAVKYIIETNNNKKTKVIILGEPWQKSHKQYLKIDPRYLNISVRRKTFYKYYFNRFDNKNNLELVVIRPDRKVLENYMNKVLASDNQVFILSHAGEFENKIKNISLDMKVLEFEKDFYVHSVHHYIKNE